MKRLRETWQLRIVSLSVLCGAACVRMKSFHEEEEKQWMQAPIQVSESSGECLLVSSLIG